MPNNPVPEFGVNPSKKAVPAQVDDQGAFIEPSYLSRNVSAAGNTPVKTGAGAVRGLSINTGATGGVVTLYDGTDATGTKLGTFAATSPFNFNRLQLRFSVGLFMVVAGTPDVTVSYN